jgi:hypothetical protein
MSSPATEQLKQPPDATQTDAGALPAKMLLVSPKLINWSALFFAILQSVCTAFVALNGVRLLIGVGAFAAASGALKLADRMHGDAIRIPMMALALLGSLLNLFVLWRVRRLRNRPAAQWRRVPLSARKKNSERLQYALSILTLILLAAEWLTHPLIHRVH